MGRVVSVPQSGSRWRHFKGGVYRVLAVGSADGDPSWLLVAYEDVDGVAWVRPLAEWHERVPSVGAPLHRFRPEGAHFHDPSRPQPRDRVLRGGGDWVALDAHGRMAHSTAEPLGRVIVTDDGAESPDVRLCAAV